MSRTGTKVQMNPKKGRERVLPYVIQDLKDREVTGRENYGTVLKSFNGRDPLVDAYQEALDLCMYLRQKIIEEKE